VAIVLGGDYLAGQHKFADIRYHAERLELMKGLWNKCQQNLSILTTKVTEAEKGMEWKLLGFTVSSKPTGLLHLTEARAKVANIFLKSVKHETHVGNDLEVISEIVIQDPTTKLEHHFYQIFSRDNLSEINYVKVRVWRNPQSYVKLSNADAYQSRPTRYGPPERNHVFMDYNVSSRYKKHLGYAIVAQLVDEIKPAVVSHWSDDKFDDYNYSKLLHRKNPLLVQLTQGN
jgi:hypothetical protein